MSKGRLVSQIGLTTFATGHLESTRASYCPDLEPNQDTAGRFEGVAAYVDAIFRASQRKKSTDG